MPVYKVGDLVSPRSNPILDPNEDNPDAIGLILEMRSMTHMKPEARILWNDMIEVGPRWMHLEGIIPLEQQACNGQSPVV